MQWVTTTLILERLAEDDGEAWAAFLERFRQPVVRFATTLGLDEADAEDVAQETLMSFVDAWKRGRYDRTKGRLSSWLFVLARQRVADVRRRGAREQQRRQPAAALEQLEDEGAAKHTWETAWRELVLQSCLQRVRGEFRARTIEAFEAFVLKDEEAETVAARLEMSPNAVFIAKHRVLKRLREMQEEYEAVT